MENHDKQPKSSKRLAILYSIALAVPIYGIFWIAYYMDFINSFVFLGTLLVFMFIGLILFIIYRKNKFKILTIFIAILLLSVFWTFEIFLTNYESHTYIASGYEEPEELLRGSGIHLMVVKQVDVLILEDEDAIRANYERAGIQLFNLYKINNKDRYSSKNQELLSRLGFGETEFQQMNTNVKSYVKEDITVIEEFLSRENLSGNSAGLGLGLTALVYQKKLENEIRMGVTGTLEPNGDVLPIGMIEEKLLISEQNDLPYIIIPLANAKEAEAVKSQHKLAIEILVVNHIDQAVEIITGLN